MNAKDTVIGTTKRLVAEIVGDGALADEGSRQANGGRNISTRTSSVIEKKPPKARTGRETTLGMESCTAISEPISPCATSAYP